MLRCMKKLLVVISFLTLFMVAHAAVKEVAIEYRNQNNREKKK